jgi:hypothetical protein
VAITVKGNKINAKHEEHAHSVEKKTLGGYINDSIQPQLSTTIQNNMSISFKEVVNTEEKSEPDSLKVMFDLREEFMVSLREKFPTANPSWPLNLSDKTHQQYCRDIALRGVEEMFEALQHLKNWKPHRTTEITEFDKDEFLEEIVDAFNYFFSLLILTGHTSSDLYEAYLKKDKIIHERLQGNY